MTTTKRREKSQSCERGQPKAPLALVLVARAALGQVESDASDALVALPVGTVDHDADPVVVLHAGVDFLACSTPVALATSAKHNNRWSK